MEAAEFAILGTDMASHYGIMDDFNAKCEREGGLTDSEEDRKTLLRMLLKVRARTLVRVRSRAAPQSHTELLNAGCGLGHLWKALELTQRCVDNQNQ